MKERVTVGTIIRTLCLILAITNLILGYFDKKLIPITDEQISELVSLIFTIATAVIGFWKNNSFTQEAIVADGIMHDLKTYADMDAYTTPVSVGEDNETIENKE